jgi:SulP family sulfate permease
VRKPRIFQDLDRGLEWCEDQILNARPEEGPIRPPTVEMLEKIFTGPEHVERFARYLKPIELPAGEFLFRRGDPSNEMFFLEAGQLSVVRERENQHSVRYRKIGPGAIVGEMGFYTRKRRSAAVVATEACRIYRLDETGIRQMQTREPAIAFALQNYLIQLLSKRLNQKTSEITNLLY